MLGRARLFLHRPTHSFLSDGLRNSNIFTLKQTDGSQLAAGSENASVKVWHENGSSSLEDNQQHDHFIKCLTWNRHSGGDHLFATGDRNGVRADRKLIEAIDSVL